MARRSLFGPVLLIVIGFLLLASNLYPDLFFWDLVLDHWPWLLVAWGAFHLAEQALAGVTGARPPRPLGGGTIVFAVFLCLLASTARQVRAGVLTDFRVGLLEVFDGVNRRQVSFAETTHGVAGASALRIEPLHGEILVRGLPDAQQVRVTGSRWMRPRHDDAEEGQAPGPLLRAEGDTVVLTPVNQDEHGGYDIIVEIPASWSVAVQGYQGSLRVEGLSGDLDVDGDDDLRVSQVAGAVQARMRQCDDFHVADIGSLTLTGSCDDVRAERVAGTFHVEGNLYDRLEVNQVDGAVEIISRRARVSAARLPGGVSLRDGRLTAVGAVDPRLELKGDGRLRVIEPVGETRLFSDRGRISIETGPDLGTIEARSVHGDVEAWLDADVAFSLHALAKRGRIRNGLFGEGDSDDSHQRRQWDSPAGSGPLIQLESEGADVRIEPLDGASAEDAAEF